MITLNVRGYAEREGLDKATLQSMTQIHIGIIECYWDNATTCIDLEVIDKLCKALSITPEQMFLFDPDK